VSPAVAASRIVGPPSNPERFKAALAAEVAARGAQENLSFFAFTATPKGRTLELFGTWDDGVARVTPRS
jgi:hypothetical protein